LFSSITALFLVTAIVASAQTTRPRRTGKQTQKTTASSEKPASDPLLKPEPVQTTSRKTSPNDPLLTVQPVNPVANTVAPADTQHAYALLEQKQLRQPQKKQETWLHNTPTIPKHGRSPVSPN
jgi:hypothetical protein